MLKYNLSQIDNISEKILSNLSETDCIFLFGELGCGKTTFARSLINQLQKKNKVDQTEVLSPTFNLLHEYEIKSLKVLFAISLNMSFSEHLNTTLWNTQSFLSFFNSQIAYLG